MGLDFLKNNGARRVRNYDPQPPLLDSDWTQSDQPDESRDWGIEISPDDWKPRDTMETDVAGNWPYRPIRFVDGKDVGRTVAWLQGRDGVPVPVRLSEIGAVALREVRGTLRREFSV